MGKVEDYNLQDEIIWLLTEKVSLREMERIFKKRGVQISRNTIRNWIRDNQECISQVGKHDDQVKEKIVSQFLDARQQILYMNRETMKLYEHAVKEGDLNSSFKALDQMGKNLLLFDKLIGQPKEEQELVRVISSFPKVYREAIENVRTRRSRSSD